MPTFTPQFGIFVYVWAVQTSAGQARGPKIQNWCENTSKILLGPLFLETSIITLPLIISRKQHRDLASSFLALANLLSEQACEE